MHDGTKRTKSEAEKARDREYARAWRVANPDAYRDRYTKRNAQLAAERAIVRAAKRVAWLAEPPPETMDCTRCGEAKRLVDFGVDRRARFGRVRICKACKAQAANDYVAADETRRRAVIDRAATWAKAHPEVGRATVLRRRARLRGATIGAFGPKEIDQRMAMFGHRCWICRGPYEQVDHVKPVSKGGAHMLCNLRPICGDCNLRKSGRWPLHRIPMLTAKVAVGPPDPPRVYLTRQYVSVIAPAADDH